MPSQSHTLQTRYTVVQDSEPDSGGPPWEWVSRNPSSGNDLERYIYNEGTSSWDLDKAVGGNTPNNPSKGATWRDTLNGTQKVYDGGWVNIGVTDHSNLSNVLSGQHHSQVASETTDGSDITEYGVSESQQQTVTLVNITGSGVLLGGWANANDANVVDGTTAVTIIVDGGLSWTIPYRLWNVSSGGVQAEATMPSVKFSSSLQVDISKAAANGSQWLAGQAIVKQ